VGVAEGEAVGLAVGVGDGVGLCVGVADGLGDAEGEADGLADAVAVGLAVGLTDALGWPTDAPMPLGLDSRSASPTNCRWVSARARGRAGRRWSERPTSRIRLLRR
jgi:hypothetical protein